jgi:hypothetical protein
VPRSKKWEDAPDLEAKVDPETRYRAFAGIELLLDLLHSSRSVFQVDLESLLIYLCVAEATMRPLMLTPNVPAEVLSQAQPPEDYRGVISRLLVSDRTGLARETVRRKVKILLEMGLLTEDSKKRIRSARHMGSPGARKAANQTHDAVQRYLARMTQLRSAGAGG